MGEFLPGFRFYPTEEELVSFYLHHQLEGNKGELHQVIPVVDIYNVEPTNLPKLAGQRCQGDTEQWFFFVPRQEREARGGRPSRTTESGYWKATGSPDYVYSSDSRVIGVKKSMVFYEGRAPTGRKTKWKMNEYRAIQNEADSSSNPTPKLRHEFSLCRVYVVSGSSRAFDRRPLENRTNAARIWDEAARTSAKAPVMVQETSSTDTSYSGGDLTDQPPEIGGSINWELVGDLSPPLWEWEQLDWL